MFGLFFIAFLICIVGLIRPFANLQRKHFGWSALGAFVLMALTAPPPEESTATAERPEASLSPAEAKELEKNNASEIAKLEQEVASVPSSDADENLRIYTRLVELVPANARFIDKKAEYQARVDARARYADDPEEALEITEFHWSKGGFGSIMVIERLTVRNDAPFAIKDFVVKCIHQGPSGTDMDSNTRKVYDLVPAGESKTVREINMGFIHSQATTSRCEISDAVAA